jgi:hypothetical protein
MGDNGEQQKKYPPGKHPNQIKSLGPPFSPGVSGNPSGKRRNPKDPMRQLMDTLAKSQTVTLDDGTEIALDQLDRTLLLLVRKAARGPAEGLDSKSPDWQFACEKVLERVLPVARAAGVPVDFERMIGVEVQHADTRTTVAFVERVREFSGRHDPGPDDVLKFLDQEADSVE